MEYENVTERDEYLWPQLAGRTRLGYTWRNKGGVRTSLAG